MKINQNYTNFIFYYFYLPFIDYYNIIHWKNPVTTIVFLVLINLGLAVFNYMQLTLISFASRKIFIFALMAIIKQHLFGKEAKECECLQKDKIEKIYYTVYDRVNKALDKLRKIILIQEIPSLIRVSNLILLIKIFPPSYLKFIHFLAVSCSHLHSHFRNLLLNFYFTYPSL